MKRVAILGSTGSIGQQTLEIIASLGSEYKVVALTAGSNDRLIAEQARKFKPEVVALTDQVAAKRLYEKIKPETCLVKAGPEGQIEAAAWPTADLVVMAQVGFSGFEPLIAAMRDGKTIALANKESLVVGGEILERFGLLNRGKILPVDSEHSAIWQCLGSSPLKEVRRIYLTASGGPFSDFKEEELERVTPEMALNHPNWRMGKKISIDSATMINKGFEVIEAKWLFDLKLDQIEVIVHRQSVVHSMVEYIDGSIIAQLGTPDMRLPIQYALTYPERKNSPVESYNLFGQEFKFEKPDRNLFPCLDLAFMAAGTGGTMPAVLNGANEIAVEYFLAGKIKFIDIAGIIASTMQEHSLIKNPEINDIIRADGWSRRKAVEIITRLSGEAK